MSNPWLRLYSEFSHDPKVQMMSEVMQRRLIMLFCDRCRNETLHETERAFHWRVSVTELAETKALFLEKGFIDESWEIINWNRRQWISDSSTDRVRKHRQALKQDETLQKRPTPVTVTAPEADTDTDSEAETDTDSHVKSSEGTNSARKSPSRPDPAIAIYDAYPRKVGKGKAIPAIRTAIKKISSEESLSTREAQEFLYRKVRAYSNSAAGNAGSLTPHPATWFNQSRYHDDPREWDVTSQGGTNGQFVNKAQQRTNSNLAALQALEDREHPQTFSDFGRGEAGRDQPGSTRDLLDGLTGLRVRGRERGDEKAHAHQATGGRDGFPGSSNA